jgi:hypothetical protein
VTPTVAGAEPAPGWYLYRFWPKAEVRCAITGCALRHPLYIGKTNEPWRRHSQHMDKQPWAHLIGGYDIDPQTFPDDAAVLRAERGAIHAELPLANDVHNRANRHRLTFTGPTPSRPDARSGRAPTVRRPAARKPVTWSRRQQRLAGLAVVWLALTCAAWWGAWRIGVTGTTQPLDAALASTTLVLCCWAQTRPKRALSRHLATVLAMILGAYVAWSGLAALSPEMFALLNHHR